MRTNHEYRMVRPAVLLLFSASISGINWTPATPDHTRINFALRPRHKTHFSFPSCEQNSRTQSQYRKGRPAMPKIRTISRQVEEYTRDRPQDVVKVRPGPCLFCSPP